MQKKIELLAPAGNMESLKAAVAAGCDAVYLGGTLFSARAFAGNFTHEEMTEAVRFCHERDVSVYVTINTLLFETEIDNAMKEVDFLYKNDVDALLVQDLGLFHRIRKEYPDFDLHCSTQMHVHNPAGCEFMKLQGAKRAVIARETSIETVRECVKTGMDIEVFAYGALCISYSGQCLMSESVKNRSGNRGMCAQLCRLRYYPHGKDGKYTADSGEYLLSPRDLSIIGRIPELIEAGVASLKIEGRMKRPEYVYLVVKTFREAIDAYYEGRKWHLSPERERELKLMFNRGFTEGHLFCDPLEKRMSHYRPNHQGVRIGTVERYDKKTGRVLVELSAPLYQHDGLRILNEPEDCGLSAERIWLNGLLANSAGKGDHVWLECRSRPYPKKGQPLQKTTDAKLLEEIGRNMRTPCRLSRVTLSYRASEGKPFRIEASDEYGHRASAESEFLCQKAQKAPVSPEKIETNLAKSGDYPYEISFVDSCADNVFLPVSVLNETRRRVLEKLNEQRRIKHMRSGRQAYMHHVDKQEKPEYRLIIKTDRPSESSADGILEAAGDMQMHVISEKECAKIVVKDKIISNPGDLGMELVHTIAGMNLNCANSYALAFLLSIPGIDSVILSSEADNVQIRFMLERFEERYGFKPYVFKPVYGRRTLMYIKDGFMKEKCAEMEDLQGRVYPLRYSDGITEVLEPEPYVSDNPYCWGSYLILTDEDSRKIQAVKEEAYEEVHERV